MLTLTDLEQAEAELVNRRFELGGAPHPMRGVIEDELARIRKRKSAYLRDHPDMLRKSRSGGSPAPYSASAPVTAPPRDNGHQRAPEGPATYAEARRQIEAAMLGMLDEPDSPLARSMNAMLRDMHARLRAAERGKTMKSGLPRHISVAGVNPDRLPFHWIREGDQLAKEWRDRIAWAKAHPAAAGPHVSPHVRDLPQASNQADLVEAFRPSELKPCSHPALARRF